MVQHTVLPSVAEPEPRSQAPEPRTSGAAQKSDVSATLFLPQQLQLPQKLEADRTLVSLLAQNQASPEVTEIL